MAAKTPRYSTVAAKQAAKPKVTPKRKVALKAAGKKPGTEVKIISIDGIKDAVQSLADGTYNGVIESNPRFGPLAFKTAQEFLNGTAIPEDVIISDKEYTPETAAAEVGAAY